MDAQFTTTNAKALANLPLPPPRHAVAVRKAVVADLPFIDQLQKMHGHMVGFMPTAALTALIAQQHILIAADEGNVPFGYLIAKDTYMQQEQVGIIYQLNVVPMRQRHLIGAALVKAFFAGAPYGMRLCCCWCAQDLAANYFWQSIGFVPLAFRTGSRAKQRIHIFWQGRVRAGDLATPWWFPSQTRNGWLREDRLILPILPGQAWQDAKPMVLPGVGCGPDSGPKLLANGLPVPIEPAEARAAVPTALTVREHAKAAKAKSKHLAGILPGHVRVMTSNGVRQFKRPDYDEVVAVKKPVKAPKPKNEPVQVRSARELRDRFLEIVNATPAEVQSQYDVRRQLAATSIESLLCLPPKSSIESANG